MIQKNDEFALNGKALYLFILITDYYLFIFFTYFLRDGIWVTIMWLANRCHLEHQYQGKLIIPLHPNISMNILQTVLYTFPKVLTGRICLKIKSFFGDQFLDSRDFNVWFKEKLDAGQGKQGEGKG